MTTTTRHDASVLKFAVELNGRRGWYPFMGNYLDLFAARECAASLAGSQGREARVTDSDGKVWA
jgi:hypothetical protein